jgi:hypothetical protein
VPASWYSTAKCGVPDGHAGCVVVQMCRAFFGGADTSRGLLDVV